MKVTLRKRGKVVSQHVTRDGVAEKPKYNKYKKESQLRVSLVQNNSLKTPVVDLVEPKQNAVKNTNPQKKVVSVSLKEEPKKVSIVEKPKNEAKVLKVSLKDNSKQLSSTLTTNTAIVEEVDENVKVRLGKYSRAVPVQAGGYINDKIGFLKEAGFKAVASLNKNALNNGDENKVSLSSLKYNKQNEEVIIDKTQGVHINDCEVVEDNNAEEVVDEIKEEKIETKNSHVVYDGGLTGLGIDVNKLRESMLINENDTDNYDKKYDDVSDKDMEKFYNSIAEENEKDEFSHEAQHNNRDKKNTKKVAKFKYDESYDEY